VCKVGAEDLACERIAPLSLVAARCSPLVRLCQPRGRQKTSAVAALVGLKAKPLGNDLLSQAVSSQVPSVLAGLTSGFGMGPGVSPPLQSPRGKCTQDEVFN
jgi:hypothetical protein